METAIKKILVPIDGSANAERALIEAKKQVANTNASVTILTVVKPLFLPYYGKSEILKEDTKAIEKTKKNLLEVSAGHFEDFSGEVETKLREGNPAEEIITESEEFDYDLIVMGSKGLGVFARALLGSVSSKVLNHTKTNVLIVK
ncbi:MAG: universal stress protein [Atopostipes sp.]|nr:universal stress protein [Atopostipes sp.]